LNGSFCRLLRFSILYKHHKWTKDSNFHGSQTETLSAFNFFDRSECSMLHLERCAEITPWGHDRNVDQGFSMCGG
jgi:hypothetical protein